MYVLVDFSLDIPCDNKYTNTFITGLLWAASTLTAAK